MTARTSAAPSAGSRTGIRSLSVQLLLPLATAITLLALVVAVLLLPAYVHPALDAAGAPRVLGLPAEQTHSLSDRTVGELLLGPGTFDLAGPDGRRFYDEAEAGHLRDVRLVLYGFLALGLASAALLVAAAIRGRHAADFWVAIARGGIGVVVATVLVGAFAVVAFDVGFELFHRLLFPGGNWAFDPTTQRLVQLYPLAFWQITAGAFAVLAVGGGLAAWAIGRRRARQLTGHR